MTDPTNHTQHLPLQAKSDLSTEHKRLMQQVMDDADEPISFNPNIHPNVLMTRDVNRMSHNVSSKGHSTRRFHSVPSTSTTNTSTTKRKVTLEVPLQYLSSGLPGLVIRQTPRLAIQASFPVFTPQQRSKQHQSLQGTTTTTTQQYLVPDITCHLSATTAMRGRNGYTSGSVNIQYRWDHINRKSKTHDNVRTTIKEQTIQRWSTTAHTGIGVSESEHGRENNRRIDGVNTTERQNARNAVSGTVSNVIPIQTMKFGVCTNITHHQTSSSSLAVNVQSMMSRPRIQLPITITNEQQICIPTRSTSKRTNITVRSKCMTVFDCRSSKLHSPTINASLTFSPSTLSKSTKTSQHSSQLPVSSNKADRSVAVLQNWTINLGFDKMRDCLHPLFGFSFIVAVPNLLRSLWTLSPNRTLSNKSLDISLQWKGEQGWQFGGWWTHKRNHSRSTNGDAQPQPNPTRQIGVAVSINQRSKNGIKKSSQTPITTMIPGPSRMLSWIFTWTEGDFTLRIPILVSSAESARAILYEQGWQFFYLSFLSSIIQDVISPFFSPVTLDDKESDAEKFDLVVERSQKLRQEALMQQRFMEKQAKSRTALEVKKNGLVIQRAIIYVHQQGHDSNLNGSSSTDVTKLDENNSFETTIPLQFWLSPNESKLYLYGKRSSMLGFYDLAKNICIPSTDSIATNNKESQSTTALYGNRLWIQYAYDGQMYETSVDDDEELELPNIYRSKRI